MFVSIIIAYLVNLLAAIIPGVSGLSDNRVVDGPFGAPQPITTCIELQNMSNTKFL